MKIVFFILIIIFGITYLIKYINTKKAKDDISFDEFDDIETIKKQETIDKQSIEYESAVLNKVYKDTYKKYTSDNLNIFTHTNALLKAQDAVAKTRKDLYNFKILDSVEIDEDSIKEGSSINSLRENGNNFDIELFKKWSRQIFGCIKIGTPEQLEIVKAFISEELFNKFLYQIKQFEKDNLLFITQDLIINDCKIYDYSKSLDTENIIIFIDSMMQEYIIRKNDNTIVRGNKDKFYNKKILMTFTKKELLYKEGIIYNCPNCGGNLNLTELGKCKYCKTLIFPIRYNWTLTKFETL